MTRKLFTLVAIVLVASMALAACAPAATPAPVVEPPVAPVEPVAPVVEPTAVPPVEAPVVEEPVLKICNVNDMGGVDDKSFNATAWKGVTDAEVKYGIKGYFLESEQQTDYEKNINSYLVKIVPSSLVLVTTSVLQPKPLLKPIPIRNLA